MNKRYVLIAVGGLALVVLIAAIEYRVRDRDADPKAAEVPTAAVAIAKRGVLSNTLSLAGQFQPYQEIEVHAKVSGYVQHIYVDIGDRVRAGETLAVLEIPELDARRSFSTVKTKSFAPKTKSFAPSPTIPRCMLPTLACNKPPRLAPD